MTNDMQTNKQRAR